MGEIKKLIQRLDDAMKKMYIVIDRLELAGQLTLKQAEDLRMELDKGLTDGKVKPGQGKAGGAGSSSSPEKPRV
jgi:hypothetical protein